MLINLQAMPKAKVRQGQKKIRVNIALTEEAILKLDQMSADMGVSRSELIELIGRGNLSANFLELGKS